MSEAKSWFFGGKKQTNQKKKCSEDLNFLQRRQTDGQEAYEKMFNISSY